MVISVFLLIFLIIGCRRTQEVINKKTPIYQGMEVRPVDKTIASSEKEYPKLFSQSINQDNPFDNPEGALIEDYIEAVFSVDDFEEKDCYVSANDQIEITINISNPDELTIFSLVLNNKTYQAYEFEQNADSTKVVLIINVGEQTGIKTYMIGSMKYQEGEIIKDVTIQGDTLIEIGVTYSNLPNVQLSNVDITPSSYAFELAMLDTNHIINYNETSVKIFLFDGNHIIKQMDIKSSQDSIQFDNLSSNQLYQYAIVGIYDSLDGHGPSRVYFHKEAFYTLPYLSYINVETTEESITFDYDIDDVNNVGEITAIGIYKDDTLVDDLVDFSDKTFNDLYSHTTYTIKTTYTYDLGDGRGSQMVEISYDVTTKQKSIPELSINNISATLDTISFRLDIIDVNEVGDVTKIELYQNLDLIHSLTDLNERTFYSLLSNTTYTIKIEYTYDLNDLAGPETFEVTKNITTLAKSVPTIEIAQVTATQDMLMFEFDIVDIDHVGTITKIELFQGDTVTHSLTNLNERIFKNLLSNTTYTIEVIYTYDLSDGQNNQSVEATYCVTTLAKAVPVISFEAITASYDSMTFNISNIDVDKIGQILSINLYKEGILIESLSDTSLRMFSGLLSGNDYIINIVYIYDLNDGHGVITSEVSQNFSTLSKKTPTVIIENVLSTKDTISFDLIITDDDFVGEISSIGLYLDNELVETLSNTYIRKFDSLLTNNTYLIEAIYTYDLNDGTGNHNILTSYSVTTNAAVVPMMTIENISVTQDAVNFDIEIDDYDFVGQVTSISLYQSDTLIEDILDLNTRTITNLLSNNTYILKVIYTYDLNDGTGAHQIEVSKTIKTDAKVVPVVSIIGVSTTQDMITYNLDILDYDFVGDVTSISLFLGEQLVDSLLDLNVRTFENLLSNNLYTIKTIYDYNLNDGTGSHQIESTYEVITNAKTIPELLISNVESTFNTIDFVLNAVDPDLVGYMTSVSLYLDELLIEDLENISTRTFEGLLSNHTYRINATYAYNLNDGVGVQIAEVNYQVSTDAMNTPVISIHDVLKTQDSVTFDLNITDADEVGGLTSIGLYQDEVLIENLIDLDQRTFSNLLSNNDYQIKTIYTYDLNDGLGSRDLVTIYNFTSIAKKVPIVALSNIITTNNSAAFDLIATDEDAVGSLTSISLYQDQILIEALANLDIRAFNGLTSNTLYSLEVIYTYDLNDGLGIRTMIAYRDVVTQSEKITITNMEVQNVNTPVLGDVIDANITFTNPSGHYVTALYVNDEKITVETIDLTTVGISFKPEFEGGQYQVSITAYEYESHGQILYQELSSTYTDEVLVLGDLDVLSVNDENDLGVLITGTSNYLLVNLDNPTGYTVSQIKLSYDGIESVYNDIEIEMIDDNTVKVLYDGSLTFSNTSYNRFITLNSITYSIADESDKTDMISDVDNYLYIVKSNIVRDITNISDLQNMENGYMYELINDIDASGYTYLPYEFIGLLDGAGYDIRNISFDIDNDFEIVQYYGLFSKFSGRIENIGIVNPTYVVNTLGTAYVGGFAGETVDAIIKNSYILGANISVTSTGDIYLGAIFGCDGTIEDSFVNRVSITLSGAGHIYAGSMIGCLGYIERSYADDIGLTVTNTGTNHSTNVGGLIGYGNQSKITDSYVNQAVLTITSNDYTYAGGISGYQGTITNSYAADGIITVDCDQEVYVGGLIGYSGNIFNSFVSGTDISVFNVSSVAVGGLIGYPYPSSEYKIYVSDNMTLAINGVLQTVSDSIVTSTELDNQLFYIDTLTWNKDIWNFAILDYKNQLYPILK